MSWSLCSRTQPAADLYDGGLGAGARRNVSAARELHVEEVDLVATLEEDRFALLLAEAATEEARTSA